MELLSKNTRKNKNIDMKKINEKREEIIIQKAIHHVARVRRRNKDIHPQNLSYDLKMWGMWGDNEFLSFISGKMEWESPPGILVTRNPN